MAGKAGLTFGCADREVPVHTHLQVSEGCSEEKGWLLAQTLLLVPDLPEPGVICELRITVAIPFRSVVQVS